MLGIREPGIYGASTYADLVAYLDDLFSQEVAQ